MDYSLESLCLIYCFDCLDVEKLLDASLGAKRK